MTFSCSLGPIDAPPHFSHIEIYLHYSFLAPDIFYEHCKICLQSFSDEVAGRQQEHILGCLLRNRARPTQFFPTFMVVYRLVYLLPVKSVVGIEKIVLTRYHSLGQLRRDPVVTHPGLAGMERLVIPVLHRALYHKRCDIDRHPFQHKHPQHSYNDEGHRKFYEQKPP